MTFEDHNEGAYGEKQPHPTKANDPLCFLRSAAQGFCAFAIFICALVFCCWLVLTCADFFGLDRVGPGLSRPWGDFALRVSMGVLLPPLLVAGLDRRHPWFLCLKEGLRAALIAFFCFASLFFIVGGLAQALVSGLRVGIIPELLRRTGPWLFCGLLYLSYRLSIYALPPRAPWGTPLPSKPLAIQLFSIMATLLIATLPLMALAPLSPFGLPQVDVEFYDVYALPQDLFLFGAVALVLGRDGLRMFRPAWVLLCLIGPLASLLDLASYPLPWQIFHAMRAGLALAACFFLYTATARRWLTD